MIPGLVLYTRQGCHLCDELRGRLKAGGLATEPWSVCDVDQDEGARALYGRRLPVLVRDGRILLEGRPDEATLVRVVHALRRETEGTTR